ncbi:MAG: hypothetical protein HYV09_10280 [Deltaproteobacteria bacterium]|nr:hypothetical protein [Deltaproteobacteria bacterium]
MRRRAFLASLATAGALSAACRRRKRTEAAAPSQSSDAAIASYEIRDWELPTEPPSRPDGERRCVVLVPRGLAPDAKVPLLIALHGMGETTSPRTGAYAWVESYGLDRALARLHHPPLGAADFRGLVTPARLAAINADLAKRPFGGLVIACPYLPRGIGSEVPYDVYGTWLGERLLPKLRAEAPVIATPQATGIDGVSLGGITALRIGLSRADLFGAIGALQPAVLDETSDALADTFAQRLGGRPLRIVTSTEDAFRDPIVALGGKLAARKVPHELFVSEGPHDYVWNQGPGGIEMALWHDRALRAT